MDSISSRILGCVKIFTRLSKLAKQPDGNEKKKNSSALEDSGERLIQQVVLQHWGDQKGR